MTTTTPPVPSTPAEALRWAADRADALGVLSREEIVALLRRWADKLDAAPRRYELPAEPPAEVTELWDRDGQQWDRTGPRTWRRTSESDDPWWRRWTWLRLLDKRGPLSTTPPTDAEEATPDA